MDRIIRIVGTVMLWVLAIFFILLDIIISETRWWVSRANWRVRYFYRDDYEDQDPRRLELV